MIFVADSERDNKAPAVIPPHGAGPVIAFRGVSKSFGALEVLRNVDIELHSGEDDCDHRRVGRRQERPS